MYKGTMHNPICTGLSGRHLKSTLRRLARRGSTTIQKLLWVSTLKVGDLVGCPYGYNVRITAVRPQWVTVHRSGRLLNDVFIATEGSPFCSALSYFTAQNKQAILRMSVQAARASGGNEIEAAMACIDRLNEDGTLSAKGLADMAAYYAQQCDSNDGGEAAV